MDLAAHVLVPDCVFTGLTRIVATVDSKLDPSEFDDHTEGIVHAALAAAAAEAARARSANEGTKRDGVEDASTP